MTLIDTHTHLFLPEFDEDRDEMLQRAMDAGIDRFYLPNIDSGTVQAMHNMATSYPDSCIPMMGLHPGSVKEIASGCWRVSHRIPKFSQQTGIHSTSRVPVRGHVTCRGYPLNSPERRAFFSPMPVQRHLVFWSICVRIAS